jgi:hypothetical protein
MVGCAVLCACGNSAVDPSTGSNAESSDKSQSPAKAAPDPCSLLTIAEASAALGGPAKFSRGETTDRPMIPGLKVTERVCDFVEVKGSQLGLNIKLAVYDGADRNYFDQSGGHAPVIPGLGDAAKGTASELIVFSKGTMVQLYGSLPNDAPTEAIRFQTLARQAIAKL